MGYQRRSPVNTWLFRANDPKPWTIADGDEVLLVDTGQRFVKYQGELVEIHDPLHEMAATLRQVLAELAEIKALQKKIIGKNEED